MAERIATENFVSEYGDEADILAAAPGRVNLIGEHTDYNDGFVLPMALPMRTAIAAKQNDGRTIRLSSDGFGTAEFSLDGDVSELEGWSRYVAAMAAYLEADGITVPGFDASISTSIPVGAGLSSSAALEIASGSLMVAMVDAEVDGAALAQIARQVENEVVGVGGGIMDQLISALGEKGSALLIDCRTNETTVCPMPEDLSVIVMDTRTRRELERSSYGDRKSQCVSAVKSLGIDSLRDVSLRQLDESNLDEIERARVKHVVTENARTLAAADALKDGKLEDFGRLMNESHESLRDDFEVSSDALNHIVESALEAPGCFGARMTGGGFGGCAVAVVEPEHAEEFVHVVEKSYFRRSEIQGRLWVVSPSEGVTIDTRPNVLKYA